MSIINVANMGAFIRMHVRGIVKIYSIQIYICSSYQREKKRWRYS